MALRRLVVMSLKLPTQPRSTEARLIKDGDRLERERKRLEDRFLRERQKVLHATTCL